MWYANISGEVVAREPHCKGRGIGSRFVSTSKNLLNLLKCICRLKILGNATWIHVKIFVAFSGEAKPRSLTPRTRG